MPVDVDEFEEEIKQTGETIDALIERVEEQAVDIQRMKRELNSISSENSD